MATDHDRYLRVIDLLLHMRAIHPTQSAFQELLQTIQGIFELNSLSWQSTALPREPNSISFPGLMGDEGRLVVSEILGADEQALLERIAKSWMLLVEQAGVEQSHDALHDELRRQLGASLQDAQSRCEMLFDYNPQPMWVFDLETLRFLSVNEAAITQYGYSRDEFLSMTVANIRPPEDAELFYQTIKNVGPVQQGRFRHLLKNGQIIHVFVQTNAILFEGRNARLVAVNDISALLRNQSAALKTLPIENVVPVIASKPNRPVALSERKDVLRGRKILIVEDSRDNQFLLERVLVSAGATVDIATNGAEGLSKALCNPYDLVIMDLQMPVMDGYTAMTQLLRSHYSKPVIALTANAFKHDQLRCAEAGFCDFATKPIDPAHLIERILFHVSESTQPESFQ